MHTSLPHLELKRSQNATSWLLIINRGALKRVFHTFSRFANVAYVADVFAYFYVVGLEVLYSLAFDLNKFDKK